MKYLISLCLLIFSTYAFAAEEEVAPIWQQGTVILIQVIAFVILIYCIGKFLFKAVSEELETRQMQIAEAYEEAEKAKEAMANASIEKERIIKEAQQEAQEMVLKATKEANAIKEAKKEEANEEAKRRLDLAQTQINNEKEKAIIELKEKTSSLGVSIAEKILNKEIKEADHQALINDFIKDLAK